ncbi:MAG: penicillin-binding protein [Anaerolineaceae bacterium]|nr:penicillin-binding protein [Anaerolineaceae bacterium]
MSTYRVYQWVKLQQKHRQQKLQQQTHKRKHTMWVVLAFITILFALAILFSGYQLSGYLKDSPDISVIPALFESTNGAFFHPTKLYDRTGSQVIYQHSHNGEARVYRSVDISISDSISPYLLLSMITLNEPDFWEDEQINFNTLFSNQPQTLAERLINRFVLPLEIQGMRRTILLRSLGQELIHTYGKAQVLEWYLNSAYFGQKAYGVESAAQLYFAKTASQLNFSEAVLLAAVEQAPVLNPIDSPAASEALYQESLIRMYERGALNLDEFSAARNNVPVFPEIKQDTRQPYQAFSNHVMQQLTQRFGQWQAAFGGLSVQTTLDLDLQQQATCVIDLQLARLQKTGDIAINADLKTCPAAYYLPSLPAYQEPLVQGLNSSIIIMDVKTGEILAYIGDTINGIESPQETRHQAASLLTPILSTAAISRGFSPSNVVWDIPPAEESAWAAYDTDAISYHGPQRLRNAIANDYMFPLLDLFDAIGSEVVWNTAATLGLDNASLRSSQAEIFLHGNSATLLEITRAYQAFAGLGTQSAVQLSNSNTYDAVFTLNIEKSDGSALGVPPTQKRSVLSPGLAYLVHHMLQDETARRPSLGSPNLTEIGRPSGVKIGRTINRDESWTVGYTTQRMITVWLGQADNENMQTIDWQLTSGIWNALMKYAGKNINAEQWQTPIDISALEVCDPSGKLPTVDCPNLVNELFISGNEPITYDDLYRSVQINKETGLLATVYTPLELVEEKTFLIIPEFAKEWVQDQKIEQPPEMYDTLTTSNGTANVNISSPEAYQVINNSVDIQGSASGENFKFYRLQVGEGLNPRTWLQISEEQTQPIEDGLLGTWSTDKDGLFAIRLSVVQEDQSLQTHIVQVTVDNTVPLVQILYPADDSQLSYDADKHTYFQVQTSDNVGIQRAAWYLDGQWIADSNEAPYGILWQTKPGKHTLVVKVYDLADNLGISEVVNFEVKR